MKPFDTDRISATFLQLNLSVDYSPEDISQEDYSPGVESFDQF